MRVVTYIGLGDRASELVVAAVVLDSSVLIHIVTIGEVCFREHHFRELCTRCLGSVFEGVPVVAEGVCGAGSLGPKRLSLVQSEWIAI